MPRTRTASPDQSDDHTAVNSWSSLFASCHRYFLYRCGTYEATLENEERTNNVCEGWNHAFACYAGHAHPSLWSLLEALHVDEATASTDIRKDARGEPPRKRVKRAVRDHQRRLQQLCADRRDGRKTVEQVLSVLGHCVRLRV